MRLGQYIKYLETKNPNTVVRIGLGNPHAWRGSYQELAFEPVENTTIGKMLNEAKSSVNSTYEGWEGGNYRMDLSTKINIDYKGVHSNGEKVMEMLLDLMTSI